MKFIELEMVKEQTSFNDLFIDKLAQLKGLYNDVNNVVILHEYIIGDFYYQPIINFRTISDYMFECYRNKNIKQLEADIDYLEATLNDAGHGTLDSILSKILNKINEELSKYEYSVIDRVIPNYNQKVSMLNSAWSYVELYDRKKDEALKKSFIDTFNAFKEIPEFYDQLVSKKHLLDASQKGKDVKAFAGIKHSHIFNTIIAVTTLLVTFIIAKPFAKNMAGLFSVSEPDKGIVNDLPTQLELMVDTAIIEEDKQKNIEVKISK